METRCRSYGNLAAMFYTRRCYRLSLRCRHAELVGRLQQASPPPDDDRRRRVGSALGHLGHALHAAGRHAAAVLAHRLCALAARRAGDRDDEARQLRNVGEITRRDSRPTYLGAGPSPSIPSFSSSLSISFPSLSSFSVFPSPLFPFLPLKSRPLKYSYGGPMERCKLP